MSLAQGNNTLTRPRIEPGSPDPESDALTTRPVRPPILNNAMAFVNMNSDFLHFDKSLLILTVSLWGVSNKHCLLSLFSFLLL